ncbi:MAG: DUF72 domain-containing protein [Firmicutes bacterium]|nr:DUF72 domain-containing protein [Bacillota bacterium]
MFYPEGITDREMLAFYANRFPLVELDFSYYQMPGIRTMEGLERKTPEGFTFCVKAHKSMTHQVPEDGAELTLVFARFREAVAPMTDAGKLGCVLLQFPWGFRRNRTNEDYLVRLRDLMAGLPAVIEFRNVEWVSEDTFGLLRREGFGFCCVDEPRLRGLFPPLAVRTSEIAYVRFHGRNARSWWNHKEAWERYNYMYSENELSEWVPKIRQLDTKESRTFVLFNNCHAGQAATNAEMMQSLLDLV